MKHIGINAKVASHVSSLLASVEGTTICLEIPLQSPPPPGRPMNLLKNNGWKCLWRGHPAQPTDQLKPGDLCTVSNHLVWYRTGLRCSAASKTLNNVVMTMRL